MTRRSLALAAALIAASAALAPAAQASSTPTNNNGVCCIETSRPTYNNAGLSELKTAVRLMHQAARAYQSAVRSYAKARQYPVDSAQWRRYLEQARAKSFQAEEIFEDAQSAQLAAEATHESEASRIISSGREPVDSRAWNSTRASYDLAYSASIDARANLQ